MKIKIILIAFIIFNFLTLKTFNCFAQIPQVFKYQLIARDANGTILSNQNLGLQISIVQDAAEGTVVYSEQFSVTTGSNGLVNIEIGKGTIISGNFISIDWGNHLHFLKSEIDPTGATNYFTMGTTQLVSVPYALHAKTVDNNMWTLNGFNIYSNNSGFVGIGTNEPTSALHVNGSLRITDESEGEGKVLKSDALGNASWQTATSTIIGDTNYLPFYNSDSTLGSSLIYQNGNRLGIGTTTPSGRVMIQADANANDSIPLFEIKDKSGKSVMIVYSDSIHFYVADNPGKANNKGSFAVSGKSTAKGLTNNYLFINPDSTRIYTSDTIKGFGVQDLSSGESTSYLRLTPSNYFIGHEAGKLNSSGTFNSFMGYKSGYSNNWGSRNTFLGYESGYNSFSGADNVFIGVNTGFLNNTGSSNVFIGNSSGFKNNFGGANVFLGTNSGFSNTNGDANVFIGEQTGYSNIIGSLNVFIGQYAGYWNTLGSVNVCLGSYAGYSNTIGDGNVYIGQSSGLYNTEGYYNVFMGNNSGMMNIDGFNGVFIGSDAGYSNISGDKNVFIGTEAGYKNQYGSNNVFLGNKAGYENKTDENVFIGFNSGTNNINAIENVFVGANTGVSNSGNGNTLLGNKAGINHTIGSNNVFFGNYCGANNVIGKENVFLGSWAGYFNNGNNNVFLGFQAGMNETGSNRLYINGFNADKTTSLIYGEFDNNILRLNGNVGIGTDATAKLDVKGTVKIGTNGSVLNNIIKATVNKDVANIIAGGSVIETFSVPNAATGSAVYISPTSDLGVGIVICYAHVSVAGTVSVRFQNISDASIDLSAMDFNIAVIE